MTYKNSRLKHVKKIIELINKLDYVQYASSYAGRILTQCNLLLETKKKKKCKCWCHKQGKKCCYDCIEIHYPLNTKTK